MQELSDLVLLLRFWRHPPKFYLFLSFYFHLTRKRRGLTLSAKMFEKFRRPTGRRVEIISRRDQPIAFEEEKGEIRGAVSSTWINELAFDPKDNSASMKVFKKGSRGFTFKEYTFPNFSLDLFERWVGAHSKGTFYHRMVKDGKYLGGRGLFTKLGAKYKARKLRKRPSEAVFEPYSWKYDWEQVAEKFEEQREKRRELKSG